MLVGTLTTFTEVFHSFPEFLQAPFDSEDGESPFFRNVGGLSHGFISQKRVIFIAAAMGISNLTDFMFILKLVTTVKIEPPTFRMQGY
jgi:hypothetical protein